MLEKRTLKEAATIGLIIGIVIAIFADDVKISISPQSDLESARSFVFYIGITSAIVSIFRLYITRANSPHAIMINGIAWGSTITSLVVLESIKWFTASFPRI